MMELQMLEMLPFQPWQLWPRYLCPGFVLSICRVHSTALLTSVAMFFVLDQSVGMRPLEKSLEKLDDVRKKKLSEMIGGSDGGPPATFISGLKFLCFFKFPIVYAGLSIYC